MIPSIPNNDRPTTLNCKACPVTKNVPTYQITEPVKQTNWE